MGSPIRAGGTAVTGADATLPLATNGTTYLWASFANYTRPTIAAADTMSLKPTTTNSATGVITPYLGYIPIAVAGVSDAVTTV